MCPEHQSLLHVPCLCVACVSVWSWIALQFALQDLKTALIPVLTVYSHCLYGTVWYTTIARLCVCVNKKSTLSRCVAEYPASPHHRKVPSAVFGHASVLTLHLTRSSALASALCVGCQKRSKTGTDLPLASGRSDVIRRSWVLLSCGCNRSGYY